MPTVQMRNTHGLVRGAPLEWKKLTSQVGGEVREGTYDANTGALWGNTAAA